MNRITDSKSTPSITAGTGVTMYSYQTNRMCGWLKFALICCWYYFAQSTSLSFIDESSNAFQSSNGLKGVVAAYGDVNNDKVVDVFVLQDNQNVAILHGNIYDSLSLKEKQTVKFPNDIESVAAGDFNGDGKIDIIATSLTTDSNTIVHISFGTENGLFLNNILTLENTPLFNQPILLDVNGDMIVDLFVTYPNQTRKFWIGHATTESNWFFHMCDFHIKSTQTSVVGKIGRYFANAFLDATGDGISNLVITSLNNSGQHIFEIWKGSMKGLDLIVRKFVPFKDEFGQSAFVDIDADGVQNHLLPACTLTNGRCQNSRIYTFKNDEWILLYQVEDQWNFIPRNNMARNVFQPMALIVGNYNQDIYVDALCLMEKDGIPQAVVLFGKACKVSQCNILGRSFEFGFVIRTPDPAVSTSFYDLGNDGTLDIFVTIRNGSSLRTRAYRNSVSADVSFLMVKILPGLSEPSGSNVYGACAFYTTTNTAGGRQRSSACQLSQSSHFSLQLPFVSFGLGRLPNFVDQLTVSVPSPLLNCSATVRERGYKALRNYWTMLIPNAQLFITPYPLHEPHSWTNRMLVSPSKNIITTGIVLLVTCFVVSMAIVVLHCIEQRHDKQEKMKNAHRFHFDAM